MNYFLYSIIFNKEIHCFRKLLFQYFIKNIIFLFYLSQCWNFKFIFKNNNLISRKYSTSDSSLSFLHIHFVQYIMKYFYHLDRFCDKRLGSGYEISISSTRSSLVSSLHFGIQSLWHGWRIRTRRIQEFSKCSSGTLESGQSSRREWCFRQACTCTCFKLVCKSILLL